MYNQELHCPALPVLFSDPLTSLLQALRVPVVGELACVRACAGGAPREADAAALSPARGSAARRGRRGRGARSRRRRARRTRGNGAGGARRAGAGDAEPLEIVVSVDGDVVGNAGAIHAHEVLTIDVLGVRGRGVVGQRLPGRAVCVAEDTGPLLQGLVEVLEATR